MKSRRGRIIRKCRNSYNSYPSYLSYICNTRYFLVKFKIKV